MLIKVAVEQNTTINVIEQFLANQMFSVYVNQYTHDVTNWTVSSVW